MANGTLDEEIHGRSATEKNSWFILRCIFLSSNSVKTDSNHFSSLSPLKLSVEALNQPKGKTHRQGMHQSSRKKDPKNRLGAHHTLKKKVATDS